MRFRLRLFTAVVQVNAHWLIYETFSDSSCQTLTARERRESMCESVDGGGSYVRIDCSGTNAIANFYEDNNCNTLSPNNSLIELPPISPGSNCMTITDHAKWHKVSCNFQRNLDCKTYTDSGCTENEKALDVHDFCQVGIDGEETRTMVIENGSIIEKRFAGTTGCDGTPTRAEVIAEVGSCFHSGGLYVKCFESSLSVTSSAMETQSSSSVMSGAMERILNTQYVRTELRIQGISYSQLVADSLWQMEVMKSVKVAVVAKVNIAGLTIEHVVVQLSEGSVIAEVTVNPPAGVNQTITMANVRSSLTVDPADTTSVDKLVTVHINAIPKINEISTGSISTSVLSAPTLNISVPPPTTSSAILDHGVSLGILATSALLRFVL